LRATKGRLSVVQSGAAFLRFAQVTRHKQTSVDGELPDRSIVKNCRPCFFLHLGESGTSAPVFWESGAYGTLVVYKPPSEG